MSVKLSELFSKAADDVFERSYDCPIDESTAIRTRSRTLRAIAPELVEFLEAHEHWRSIDDLDRASDEYAARGDFYLAAWSKLEDAMKAAGVTCE